MHVNLVFFLMISLILVSKSECQFLQLLNTHDMHVNDEYGSYATNTIALENLWAILEHLKQTLHFNASESHFFVA